jgi:hypothetical protein
MMKKKLYSEDDIKGAISDYINGTKLKNVIAKYPKIPRRTLTERARKVKQNAALKAWTSPYYSFRS